MKQKIHTYETDDIVVEYEHPVSSSRVQTVTNGPLFVVGRLQIALPDGQTVRETRAALCRGGASENKPYCDGSHTRCGFTAD